MDEITPEYVSGLGEATDRFLCPLSANIYGIEFVYFKVRDLESGTVLFEVSNTEEDEEAKEIIEDDSVRTIKYHLGPEFLNLTALGSTIGFKVGSKEVRNFRMIERHYYKSTLLKSFDFNLEFCIPGTMNTWEVIYEMPSIPEHTKAEMIAAPWETKSDSFYFVENKLIMHNKAEYNYSPLD
jgi:protein unc-119